MRSHCSFLKARTKQFFTYLGGTEIVRLATKIVVFMVSWLLFLAVMAPFVADVIIIRLRDMRFMFDLVKMAIAEKDHTDAVAISHPQMTEACLNVTALPVVLATIFFAIMRTWAHWADLSNWNPTQIPLLLVDSGALPSDTVTQQDLDEVDEDSDSDSPTEYAELVPKHELLDHAKAEDNHKDDT